ncbi:hypothetical protein BGL78_00640, partial [Helicobacter pylori]|uniref:hypothetical protein n=1 Tax=Helicobacter pylori TaxID=210 RepID=UPI0009A2CCC2
PPKDRLKSYRLIFASSLNNLIVKNAFLIFLGFLNYHHANANNHFKLSLYFIVFVLLVFGAC